MQWFWYRLAAVVWVPILFGLAHFPTTQLVGIGSVWRREARQQCSMPELPAVKHLLQRYTQQHSHAALQREYDGQNGRLQVLTAAQNFTEAK